MSSDVKTYDSNQVIAVFGGVIMADGREDGDFISIARNEEKYTLRVGADGEAARSRTNNNSTRVTVRLLNTSSANLALSALYNVGEAAGGNANVFPLLIQDLSGNSLYVAEQAWIVQMPAINFGKEVGTVEWVFETPSLAMVHGGN